jgi:transcriptional regulator GlxA family with amidase domain
MELMWTLARHFAEAVSYWAHRKPEDNVQVFTLARDNSRPIRCAKGLRVLADYSWDSTPPIDVLVYPGGSGVAAQVGDEEVRRGYALYTSAPA